MTIIDPKTGRPVPKRRTLNFPAENKNFKATFRMEHGKKVVKSTPYQLVVAGSIDPETFDTLIAIELRFRDGLVISGGPLLMEINDDKKQDPPPDPPDPGGGARVPDPGGGDEPAGV